MESPSGEITKLLEEFRAGKQAAADVLVPLVYGELRKRAGRYLAQERRGHSLQPTALVHEAYLRLFGDATIKWQNRAHFFAISAQVMRRILVDYARSRGADKRGGSWAKVSLDDAMIGSFARLDDFLILDEAMKRLARFDLRQSQIVELRFFGGLSEEETAEVLGVSTRTVKRDWRLARAWLYEQLTK
jgi:RNA polymerase sigma factor (TIGR02999 family)